MQLAMNVIEVQRPDPDRLEVILSTDRPGVSSVWTLTLHDPADFGLFLGAFSAARTLTVTVETGT